MVEYLYRFRPLKRLLDRGELLNQEIYFAEPDQLNDPMEGFRDIYWKGDAIVWKNLLKHHVVCAENAFSQWMICGEREPLNWSHIPVFNFGDMNDGLPYKKLEDEILAAIFAEDCVTAFIAALAARSFPIRRDELTTYLRSFHTLALHHIGQTYIRRGWQPEKAGADVQANALRKAMLATAQSIGAFQEIEKQHPVNEHQIDAFYASQRAMIAELDLIHFYNGELDIEQTNRSFVCVDFPEGFVRKVETLVYPEWYTACFMRDCRNSAVWGSYGDNHTAVCLKFRVSGERPCLHLRRANSINPDGPIVNSVKHEFHEITYQSEHLPIDFFRSLGRFPIPVLLRHWYSDEAGSASPCGEDTLRADEAWPKRYWDAFYHGITRKLNDWSYEQEYRLILDNMFWDFHAAADRTLPYQFSDLAGVIFGIKTPMKAKIAVCKIIEEKCRKEGRTDFKFYQAYYARSSGTIEHAEMRFLKFAG